MSDNAQAAKRCEICGDPLPKFKRRYCSDACAMEAERRIYRMADKDKPTRRLYVPRVCMDCGVAYVGHIRTKRCPECQDAANKRARRAHNQRKRAGKARPLGSTDLCEVCGGQYTVMSGLQKFCPTCASEAIRKADNAASRAWNASHYYGDDATANRQRNDKRIKTREDNKATQK